MIQSILRFFGLITINRAKFISGEIQACFTKQIQDWAEKDFNRMPDPFAINDNRKWAIESFEKCTKITDKVFELTMPKIN